MSEYESAKAVRDALDRALRQSSNVLNAYPRGVMGITPDSVRATPKWQAEKRQCDVDFAALRAFNARFVKQFKREIQAERNARLTA